MFRKSLAVLLSCFLFASLIPASVSAADTIKLGGIAVLTGSGATYGTAVRQGVDICIDEINRSGGINGKKVEMIWEDSQGNPVMGVQAYYKLVQNDGVSGIIGAVLTDVTKAVAEVAADDGIPMITASSTAYEITTDRPNVFRTCFLDPFQARMIARYAKEEQFKSVAVLYDNGDEYSTGLFNTFKEECEALGVSIIAAESASSNDVDFKAQLTNLKSLSPDAVFLPYYGAPAAFILKQAGEVGLNAKFFGADGISNVIDSISDMALLEGVVYTDHFTNDSSSEAAVRYLKTFEEAYGVKPSLAFSATAYDAALVMCEALKNAPDNDPQAICDAIKKSVVNGVTGAITFDDHNDPIKSIFFITFDKEGNKVFLKRLDP